MGRDAHDGFTMFTAIGHALHSGHALSPHWRRAFHFFASGSPTAAHLRDFGLVLYSPARAAHPLEAPLERFQSRQNETLSRSSPRFHRDSVHCDIGRQEVATGSAPHRTASSQEPNLTTGFFIGNRPARREGWQPWDAPTRLPALLTAVAETAYGEHQGRIRPSERSKKSSLKSSARANLQKRAGSKNAKSDQGQNSLRDRSKVSAG